MNEVGCFWRNGCDLNTRITELQSVSLSHLDTVSRLLRQSLFALVKFMPPKSCLLGGSCEQKFSRTVSPQVITVWSLATSVSDNSTKLLSTDTCSISLSPSLHFLFSFTTINNENFCLSLLTLLLYHIKSHKTSILKSFFVFFEKFLEIAFIQLT